jgi:hypothetical protein
VCRPPMLEPRHFNPAALEDLVPGAASLVVSPDWDASITRLVELRQASPCQQTAAALDTSVDPTTPRVDHVSSVHPVGVRVAVA